MMSVERLPRKPSRWKVVICAFAAFLTLAIAQSWPLPLHLSTHFTGDPRGDTGVYVWNIWVFHHELIETHTTPFSTLEILPLDGPTDLSLHNYTVVSDLLALPFLRWLGVVRTFNSIYILNVALAGFAAFLLIRRLTNRPVESFVGGLVFMWSPFLVARGAGHFSLVAAAPLPIFMLMLDRAWDTQRLRDAALVGLVVTWAAFSDPYYAVYCLMLGGCFLANRLWQVSVVRRPIAELRAAKHLLTVAIVVIVGLVLLIKVFGGGRIQIGPVRLSMRTLYTPMLALTILSVLRLWLTATMNVRRIQWPSREWLMRAAMAAGVTTVLVMSPVLSALSSRMVKGGMVGTSVMWRSSAAGVDALSFLMPNPNHVLLSSGLVNWIARESDGYVERVASLSLIGLALVVGAWLAARFRPPRFWLFVTLGFGLLALGPFIHVGGINLHVPTPWALLRYMPIVGAARVPTRFDAVVMLGFAVLVALAIIALVNRHPSRRRLILTTASLALMAELFPAPRTLYSAEIPKVYDVVAADPRPIRVLTLPTGIKDGLGNLGNFAPEHQYYQTFHHKGVIGGYLSRVEPSSKAFYANLPVMAALMRLSEGGTLEPDQAEAASRTAATFLRRGQIGYVVWRSRDVTPDLRAFATMAFGLTKVADSDGYELFTPRDVTDTVSR